MLKALYLAQPKGRDKNGHRRTTYHFWHEQKTGDPDYLGSYSTNEGGNERTLVFFAYGQTLETYRKKHGHKKKSRPLNLHKLAWIPNRSKELV